MSNLTKSASPTAAPSPNPNTPQVPPPAANVGSLAYCVQALKQVTDSLSGFRGKPTDRAVTFNDLINMGLVSSDAAASQSGTTTLRTGGTVTDIETSGGIHGGPITTKGTLTVDWNSGTVEALGTHMELTDGTLDAQGFGSVTTVVAGAGLNGGTITTSGTISANWQAGTVTVVGAGLFRSGKALMANWQAPIVHSLGTHLTISGDVLNVAGFDAPDGMVPLTTGELDANGGPILIADPDGQCVGVPLT